MVSRITSNGAADVPQISKSPRDRRRTIGFVKTLNGTGVLHYVLLKGRKRRLVTKTVGAYLEDPLLAKTKCKKHDTKDKKMCVSTRVWNTATLRGRQKSLEIHERTDKKQKDTSESIGNSCQKSLKSKKGGGENDDVEQKMNLLKSVGFS